MLTFDLTNRTSFECLADWIDETFGCASSNIQIILIGNKSDLKAHRQIKYEEALEFAK